MMSSEFVASALKAAGEKTCYALGMWGQKIEDGIVEQKTKQYPDWYGRNASKLVYGAYGFDCICFVKALLWGWQPGKPAVYEANGVPDVAESTMLGYCENVSANMDDILNGEYLWKDGHCGIYHDGKVIECTTSGTRNVQVNPFDKSEWKKHGMLTWIDYSDAVVPPSDSETAKSIINNIRSQLDDLEHLV